MQPTASTVRPSPLLEADVFEQTMYRRLTYGAAIILAAAGVFTCGCDTPMIWDGAYQFCFTLITDHPYSYLTRFHSYLLWIPVWLLSHVTGNLTLLKFAYGLPFTLAPAASVLLSWWVVRRRAPRLIVWAIFGVAAGPLPGQIFIINDSIFQQHMFWPVFLGLLVPLTSAQVVGLALLAVFQLSHQIGLVLLAGGAGAAGVLALLDRRNRPGFALKATICLALAAVAVWKIFAFPDSYARQEFTWERAKTAWLYGVAGWSLRGLICMWAAAGALLLYGLLDPRRHERFRRAAAALSVVGLLCGLLIWSYWAHDERLWSDAFNYRRWVVPLTGPFYGMALVDAAARLLQRRTPASPCFIDGARRRVLIGYGVACTFAVVLTLQSVRWARITRRLMRDVEQYPSAIVPWSAVEWATGTPLQHWGPTSFVFVLEGRQPRRLLLEFNPEARRAQLDTLRRRPPRIPLSPFTPVSPWPGPTGWFNFRPLLDDANAAVSSSGTR